MRAIGILILAGVGYVAYKNRATLLGGRPASTPLLNTPAGAIVPIAPTTTNNAPGNTGVVPTVCPTSSQQLLEKAIAWTKGSDRSYPSLLGLLRNQPRPCRRQMGEALKIAGVPIATVTAAVAAAG